MLRKFGDGDLEAGLDGGHDLLVALRRLEGDGQTLGTETTSTTMKRSVYVLDLAARRDHTQHGEGSCPHPEGSHS
jgi:hypothetical protein